jgi:monoterpene epsilon-lactone hydrolase
MTGTCELLFSQAMDLREQDVVVDLRVWDDLWHVFEWDEQLPEALESVGQMAKFLTEHMGQDFTG